MNKLNFSSFKTYIAECDIDYFFVSASFEDRCFVIANIIKDLNYNSLVFYNTNEYPEVAENAEKLVGLLNGEKVALSTNTPIDNYQILFEQIKNLDRKPNILIDTTTFTHETLLVLIKLCEIFKDKLGTILIAYVGAREYSTAISEDSEKWLSKGISEIRTIIGFPGISDPTRKNHLLVLFGFESERTKKLIEEYEYDYVTLGFGDQPISQNHLKINYERHRQLLMEYTHAQEFQFCLVDPHKTCEQILQYISSPGLVDMNTVIAPLNNKLSTIGAGLAAISNENIQLAYAKPNVYNIDGYSTANEDIYVYPIAF